MNAGCANKTVGVARGCTGCTCTPRAEKILGQIYIGKVVSAPQTEQESIFRKVGSSGGWE